MLHDVFISYAAQDKHVADAICSILESNRIRCWIAPRDILPGNSYGSSIIDAISHTKIMVLVFSSNSNNSNFVINEVERAVSKGIIIIPFRIENILPSKDMEFFVSRQHWLDALTPPVETHINKLVETISVFISADTKISGDRIINQEQISSDHNENLMNGFTKIKMGQTVSEVEKVLNYKINLTEFKDDHTNYYFCRFIKIGVWLFFKAEDKTLYTIRYESPFGLAIGGVKIGYTKEQVKELIGEPHRKWFDDEDKWLYDSPEFVRYDFDKRNNGKVKTILR
jgi:hypothetical protein